MNSPGPLGSGRSRPSRKTIPRSYSRATFERADQEEDEDEENDAGGDREDGHGSIL